jgi:hypothetical protein
MVISKIMSWKTWGSVPGKVQIFFLLQMSLAAPSTGEFLFGVKQPECAVDYPLKPRADVKDEVSCTSNACKLPWLV